MTVKSRTPMLVAVPRVVIRRMIAIFPSLNILLHLLHYNKPKSIFTLRNILQSEEAILESYFERFRTASDTSRAIDLGCGLTPANPFHASRGYGIDLFEDPEKDILKCNLGFESLDFDSNSIDYVTAFDLLEHMTFPQKSGHQAKVA
jgi:hypothetical protein